MDEASGLTLRGRRGHYRPTGSVTFDEVVAMVCSAVAAARAARIVGLLIDTTALSGFAPPGTFERFAAAERWADAAGGQLCLAVVARTEMIDPQKFGVTVASNRGLVSDIFATEAEAVAWLDAQLGGREPADPGSGYDPDA